MIMKSLVAAVLFTTLIAGCQPTAGLDGASLASSATPALGRSPAIELASFAGKMTFQEAMLAPGGIKEAIDRDYASPVTFLGPREFADNLALPADSVVENVLWRRQKDGTKWPKLTGPAATPEENLALLQAELAKLGSAAPKDVFPSTMYFAEQPRWMKAARYAELKKTAKPGLMLDAMNRSGVRADLWGTTTLVLLANGSGTMVVLDDQNHFLNVGYAPGNFGKKNDALADVEWIQRDQDVRSGRSFGGAEEHRLLDASDAFYLRSLQKYLTSEPAEASKFYAALLQVILRSDPSGLKSLSPAGQAVATDFIAVYTAELDRHLMSNLESHAWEWDLAEATISALYVAKTGMMYREVDTDGDGEADSWVYKRGEALNFWDIGPSGRSGIGVTKQGRHMLQERLTAYVRRTSPKLIDDLGAALGISIKRDALREMTGRVTFGPQAELRANAPAIIAALEAVLAVVDRDAAAIDAEIRKTTSGAVAPATPAMAPTPGAAPAAPAAAISPALTPVPAPAGAPVAGPSPGLAGGSL
jgi:hypothetical protein